MARTKATIVTMDKATMNATEHSIVEVLEYPTPTWAKVLLSNGAKMIVPTETVEISLTD